jgi:hypothetical protein
MVLPGSAYLYTLATLAMTFAGFCAIVIVSRQTTGREPSGFHLVLTRLYLELTHFRQQLEWVTAPPTQATPLKQQQLLPLCDNARGHSCYPETG